MADFCLKCFNKVNNRNYTKFDVIEEWGICEECGEHTNVVVDLRGFGLFNFVSWMFNRISIAAESFYDRYLWERVRKIRFRYTKEQKQALSGQIPMTEELFWGCLDVCYGRSDSLQLRQLLQNHPEYMRKYLADCERERSEHPELRAAEEQEWLELKQRLIDEFGEEYVGEHFRD